MRTLLFMSMAFLTGCADLAWHLAQTPALKSVNQRMNDRSLDKGFSGDPLIELQKNIEKGDLRFRGIMEISTDKTWIPGIKNSDKLKLQAEYLCADQGSPWLTEAESYYSSYNLGLLKHTKKTEQGAAANP